LAAIRKLAKLRAHKRQELLAATEQAAAKRSRTASTRAGSPVPTRSGCAWARWSTSTRWPSTSSWQ
jgi:hypothetical protein